MDLFLGVWGKPPTTSSRWLNVKDTFFNIMNCACQIIDIFQKIAAFFLNDTSYLLSWDFMLFCPKQGYNFSVLTPFDGLFQTHPHSFQTNFSDSGWIFEVWPFPRWLVTPKDGETYNKNPPQIPLSLFKSSLDITVICRVYFASVDGAVEIWVEPVRYRL